jgi:hypothetical protein
MKRRRQWKTKKGRERQKRGKSERQKNWEKDIKEGEKHRKREKAWKDGDSKRQRNRVQDRKEREKGRERERKREKYVDREKVLNEDDWAKSSWARVGCRDKVV